jgi:hypothetical protein
LKSETVLTVGRGFTFNHFATQARLAVKNNRKNKSQPILFRSVARKNISAFVIKTFGLQKYEGGEKMCKSLSPSFLADVQFW